jgi:hypothetical protein
MLAFGLHARVIFSLEKGFGSSTDDVEHLFRKPVFLPVAIVVLMRNIFIHVLDIFDIFSDNHLYGRILE